MPLQVVTSSIQRFQNIITANAFCSHQPGAYTYQHLRLCVPQVREAVADAQKAAGGGEVFLEGRAASCLFRQRWWQEKRQLVAKDSVNKHKVGRPVESWPFSPGMSCWMAVLARSCSAVCTIARQRPAMTRS